MWSVQNPDLNSIRHLLWMNCNTDCDPDLFMQHRCWTSLMQLQAQWKKLANQFLVNIHGYDLRYSTITCNVCVHILLAMWHDSWIKIWNHITRCGHSEMISVYVSWWKNIITGHGEMEKVEMSNACTSLILYSLCSLSIKYILAYTWCTLKHVIYIILSQNYINSNQKKNRKRTHFQLPN